VEFNQNRIQQNSSRERRNKDIRRVSGKLDDHRIKKLTCSTGNKQVQYFPGEDLIVKGNGLVEDPINIKKKTLNYIQIVIIQKRKK
jgi:hypothetical protein